MNALCVRVFQKTDIQFLLPMSNYTMTVSGLFRTHRKPTHASRTFIGKIDLDEHSKSPFSQIVTTFGPNNFVPIALKPVLLYLNVSNSVLH